MAEYILRDDAEKALLERCKETGYGGLTPDDIRLVMRTSWRIPTADVVERNQWIPVTERLPERNYNCLVADDGTIVYGYMNFTGEWMDCLGDKLKYVSHWMPLPQPPKEEA